MHSLSLLILAAQRHVLMATALLVEKQVNEYAVYRIMSMKFADALSLTIAKNPFRSAFLPYTVISPLVTMCNNNWEFL